MVLFEAAIHMSMPTEFCRRPTTLLMTSSASGLPPPTCQSHQRFPRLPLWKSLLPRNEILMLWLLQNQRGYYVLVVVATVEEESKTYYEWQLLAIRTGKICFKT